MSRGGRARWRRRRRGNSRRVMYINECPKIGENDMFSGRQMFINPGHFPARVQDHGRPRNHILLKQFLVLFEFVQHKPYGVLNDLFATIGQLKSTLLIIRSRGIHINIDDISWGIACLCIFAWRRGWLGRLRRGIGISTS